MKYFQAYGNRCAISFRELRLPVSDAEALAILQKKKFHVVRADILGLARSVVGKAQYKRGSRLYEAPFYFDCSSLAGWLYGQLGIRIPRRSIQQFKFGVNASIQELRAGDLVFVSGHIDYYYVDKAKGVGHVGIATGEGTIIHAANRKYGVVESAVSAFIGDKFRGVRRIIQDFGELITLETPPEREIVNSADIRWVILQNLKAGS